MNRYIVVLCCIRVSLGCIFPDFNFSMTNVNKTGDIQAKVVLDHDGEHPWDVYLNKSTVSSECHQKITIVFNKAVLSDVRRGPPPGYDLEAGVGYFRLHKDKKTWHEAFETCGQEGGHLLVINSELEAQAIVSLIIRNNASNTVHYIGFHDQYKEGEYITVLPDQTLESTGYLRWSLNEPDHKATGNCGCFYFDIETSKFGLCDYKCMLKENFICEYND